MGHWLSEYETSSIYGSTMMPSMEHIQDLIPGRFVTMSRQREVLEVYKSGYLHESSLMSSSSYVPWNAAAQAWLRRV